MVWVWVVVKLMPGSVQDTSDISVSVYMDQDRAMRELSRHADEFDARLDGDDDEWFAVGRGGVIGYAILKEVDI